MASSYANDLRLNEMATGDASGSWGTNTNTNLELIGEALGFGTEAITTNADTHTSTIADGASDPIRAIFIKYTGTLDSACTITIGPNTVNKFCFIHNATSGSQSIIISQGSGANVTIATGQTKGVYLDGGSGGAAVVDAFATLSVVDLNVSGNLDVDGTANLDAVDIDGAVQIDNTVSVGVNDTGYDVKFFGDTASAFMLWDASADDLILGGAAGLSVNSATLVTGVLTTTAATVFNGGFASNADSTITVDDNGYNLTLISTDTDENSGPRLKFFRNSANPASADFLGLIDFTGKDAGGNETRYANIVAQIASPVAGGEGGKLILEVATHDGEMQTGFEIIDGNAEDELDVNIGSGTSSVTTIAGTLLLAGTGGLTTTGGNNLTVSGSVADHAGLIFATHAILPAEAGTDASPNVIDLGADGAEFKSLYLDTSIISSNALSITVGTDLTVDAGGDIILDADGGDIFLKDGGTHYGSIKRNNGDLQIHSETSDKDILFVGNDGGSAITALTLDMSAAGAATFNTNASLTLQGVHNEGGGQLFLKGTDTPAASKNLGQVNFGNSDDQSLAMVRGESTAATAADLVFLTEATGAAIEERMRISSTGSVFIGKTSSTATQDGFEFRQDGECVVGRGSIDTVFIFQDINTNGDTVGSISISSSATAYNTSSDYRLKENVDYTWDATTRLKQLKPARFNFISDDTNTLIDGFLAHEAQAVVPTSVFGAKDAVQVWKNGDTLPDGVSVGDNKLDADGNTSPQYQQIDQSKLVPLLVKTIQELEARITVLEG